MTLPSVDQHNLNPRDLKVLEARLIDAFVRRASQTGRVLEALPNGEYAARKAAGTLEEGIIYLGTDPNGVVVNMHEIVHFIRDTKEGQAYARARLSTQP